MWFHHLSRSKGEGSPELTYNLLFASIFGEYSMVCLQKASMLYCAYETHTHIAGTNTQTATAFPLPDPFRDGALW